MLIIGFILSLVGYFYVVKKLFKIDFKFVPLTVFSFIGLVVYFGGLANYLLEISYLIYGLGIICFIYYLFKHPVISISLFDCCFIIGSILFLSLLLNTNMIHYDNYSHWAIVIKEMIITNSFPTINSTVIDFMNYPLGTSSLIYYGCLFLGHSQGVMLFIQGIYIFACFYAIFGIIQERKRFLLYVFLASGCAILSIFNITIRINNLLVDFILPIVTLAVFSILYTYRNDLKKAMICIPILGILTIVKSTGVIFVGIDLVYFIYLIIESKKIKNIKYFILSLLSFIPTILWNIHMTSFSSIQHKFDVSSNLQSVDKTGEQIREIINLFIKSTFDFTSRQTLGVFIFEILAILTCVFVYIFLKKKWSLLKAMIALDIMLVLYYLGILAMYIFSMPLDEALYLAGFERYSASIVVLFCGALVMCATVDLENSFSIKMYDVYNYRAFKSVKTKKYYQVGIIVCLALSVITLLSEYNGMIYNQNQYDTSLVNQVKEVTGDRWQGNIDHSKYLVFASDKDSQVTNYYLQYITRYMLYADHVDGICLFYEDNLVNLLNQYDYLVIVETSKEERKLLKNYFNVDGDRGIYSVNKLFSKMTDLAKKQYAYLN